MYTQEILEEMKKFVPPLAWSLTGGGEQMLDMENAIALVIRSGVVLPERLKAEFLDDFDAYYYQTLKLMEEDEDEFFFWQTEYDYPKFVAMEPVIQGRVPCTEYDSLPNMPYPDWPEGYVRAPYPHVGEGKGIPVEEYFPDLAKQ